LLGYTTLFSFVALIPRIMETWVSTKQLNPKVCVFSLNVSVRSKLMGVREQMIKVLRSSDAQRIHFSFTGSTNITITVDGSTFRRVAQALEENSVHVVEGGVSGGWAQYSA